MIEPIVLDTRARVAAAYGPVPDADVRAAHGRLHDRLCWLLVRNSDRLNERGIELIKRCAFAAFVDSREGQ